MVATRKTGGRSGMGLEIFLLKKKVMAINQLEYDMSLLQPAQVDKKWRLF